MEKEQLKKEFEDFWFNDIVSNDCQADHSYIFEWFASKLIPVSPSEDKTAREIVNDVIGPHVIWNISGDITTRDLNANHIIQAMETYATLCRNKAIEEAMEKLTDKEIRKAATDTTMHQTKTDRWAIDMMQLFFEKGAKWTISELNKLKHP